MSYRTRRETPPCDPGSRSRHSRRSSGGRRPRVRRSTLPQDRQRYLPCDSGDARQAHMMQVLSVAAEAYPLVKTGGLGDVAGALPGALAGNGVMVTTLLPGYPGVREHIEGAPLVHHYSNLMGAEARILA